LLLGDIPNASLLHFPDPQQTITHQLIERQSINL